jgi:hypothetical protein
MDLSKTTPEERRHIALHMISPFRCGGCSYKVDGERIYMAGGVWYTEAQIKAWQARTKPCPVCGEPVQDLSGGPGAVSQLHV